MALLLRCVLCARTQADGLLSRGFWGFLVVSDGRSAQVCPTCKGERGWEDRARAVSDGTRVAGVMDIRRRSA